MLSVDDLPPPGALQGSSSGFTVDDLPPPPGPSASQSALRGVAGGITGGFDDEATGVVGGAGRVFGIKNLGSWKPFDPDSHLETTDAPLSADEIVNSYRENRDAIRGQQAQDMATNPKATIAGNLAGAIVSPVSKIGAGGELAANATRGERLAAAMKMGAKQGAVFGAGSSNSDLTKGDVGQFASDTALGAATGAVIPPAVEGAIGAAKGVANGAGMASRKLFSSAFGITEDNAAKYLANRQGVNSAPELAQIKDGVDNAVKKLGDAVDSGKIQVDQAHDALADLKAGVRNQLVDAKVDARDAVRRTDSLFQEAAANAIQPLKDIKAPTNRAADVSEMVGQLKQKVQGASGQALETLNGSNAKIDLAPVYSQIDKTIDGLKGAGTDEAASIASKLQDYKARLMTKNWAQVGAPEAKKLIQGLDQITEYSPMQGAFDKAKNGAFKGVRSSLDQSLKDSVPEYRAQMEPVAQQAGLLGRANDAFGTPEAAVSKLGRLNTPKGEFDRATLSQLEQAVGKPGAVTGDADKFARAQATLKDPQSIEAIKRALPEYDAYRGAMAKLAKMNPAWSRDQLEQALSKSKEARALSMAEDTLSKAQTKLDPVSILTPSSTQAKLESFGKPKGAPIETARALSALDKASGNNFTQQVRDRGVLDSFSKSNTNGARNTIFGALLGAAFHGVEGAIAGGTVGATVIDKYGPKVGKVILDGIGKIRENPSIQTIRSLSLPDPVKQDLEREFNVYMIKNRASGSPGMGNVASSQRTPDRKPTGEDRWAQSGLKSLGISDQATTQTLLSSPKGKQLLIQASDLKPGSKAMQKVNDQIQQILKGAK